MTQAYRLVAAKHREAALSGEGARLHGGRWTRVGTPAVYAAGTLSLAVLELLVHLHIEEARKRYAALVLEWPDGVANDQLRLGELPQRWRAGEIPLETQLLGQHRLERVCALRVPSVIIAREHNWVLNPTHADFARIRVIDVEDPFFLDPRLHAR